MKGLLVQLDRRTKLMYILLLFWGLFWILNGGDKRFNGSNEPNAESWSKTAVLVDDRGEITASIHPVNPQGLYGVNRNQKMIEYFDRIHLPSWVALGSLYGIGLLETAVGTLFLVLLAFSVRPRVPGGGLGQLFEDRTLHRLAFKTGVFIFLLFSVADILFGDRTELWEHGTFMVLTILTYDMWYRTDQWVREHEELQAGRA
jgi:hypothetical protein